MRKWERAKPRRPLRVLIADDEPAIRLMCRVNLQLEGIEVVEAADGGEAVDLALADPPDVAIIDIAMPELDGWQVADRLRESSSCGGVPVVFITANGGSAARRRAGERGGVLLEKPFDPVRLPELVRAAAMRPRP
jgi:CheY-like chemotaxis protein